MAQDDAEGKTSPGASESPGQDFQLQEKSFQMYSTLISMGFEDMISMRAANKHPKDAQRAIEWIVTQQSSPSSNTNNKDKQPQPRKSSSHNRPPPPPRTRTRSNHVSRPSHKPPPPKRSSDNVLIQDIESWVTENKLGQSVLTALKESEVNSTNDLYFLKVEDIEEFANDLGLKILPRKKFQKALTALLQNNNKQSISSQSQASIHTQPEPGKKINYNPYDAPNPYANSQGAKPNDYNPYDSSQRSASIASKKSYPQNE